jgi:hypothetical protein
MFLVALPDGPEGIVLEEYLSVKAAAEHYGYRKCSLRRLLRAGRLKGIKIGKSGRSNWLHWRRTCGRRKWRRIGVLVRKGWLHEEPTEWVEHPPVTDLPLFACSSAATYGAILFRGAPRTLRRPACDIVTLSPGQKLTVWRI